MTIYAKYDIKVIPYYHEVALIGTALIVRRGKQYLVMDRTGFRILGRHATFEQAKTQLYAIEWNKKKRAKLKSKKSK